VTSAFQLCLGRTVTSPPPPKKLAPSVKSQKYSFAKRLGVLDRQNRTRRRLEQLLVPGLYVSLVSSLALAKTVGASNPLPSDRVNHIVRIDLLSSIVVVALGRLSVHVEETE